MDLQDIGQIGQNTSRVDQKDPSLESGFSLIDKSNTIQGNQTDRIFSQQADFDLFKPAQKESHSIACGGDEQVTITQATDARDMVKDLTN